MSDERLREAERRWKESGSVDDEARYLLERVRVGDLTRDRLELAAYCGNEGARCALGPTKDPLSSAADRVRGLFRWGREAVLRSLCPVVRHELRHLSSQGQSDPDSWAMVDAVERWILCPCDQHSRHMSELEPRLAVAMFLETVATGKNMGIRHSWHGDEEPSPEEWATAIVERTTNPGEATQLSLGEVAVWALLQGDPLVSRQQSRGLPE